MGGVVQLHGMCIPVAAIALPLVAVGIMSVLLLLPVPLLALPRVLLLPRARVQHRRHLARVLHLLLPVHLVRRRDLVPVRVLRVLGRQPRALLLLAEERGGHGVLHDVLGLRAEDEALPQGEEREREEHGPGDAHDDGHEEVHDEEALDVEDVAEQARGGDPAD